jgi:ribosomal protein S18 acetylase RimI-like enzyme
MMSSIIRTAAPEDVASLTELMYEYIGDFYKNPRPPVDKLHQLIHTLFNKQQGIQFVLVDNGQMVGFATLYFTFSTMKAEKMAVMNDLYVKEAYRNSEHESRLFLECKNYCISHGFSNMTWITSVHNTRAQGFFREMNAVQGKEWVHFSIY